MRDFKVIKYCLLREDNRKESIWGYIVKYDEVYYFIYDFPERELRDEETSWVFDIECHWTFYELDENMRFYEKEYSTQQIDLDKLLKGETL
ncbi:MAG: hypothetical protein J6Q67_02445 [Clostridia bacterium]|nr:hypothetical protein [Clostridia bacterium]